MTAYANNLISYIKGNNPAWTLANVAGGKSIIPLTGSPIRQTSLPYLSTNQPTGFPQNWGATVPNAYRPCIAITMPITCVTPTTCANATPNPATGCATQTATPGPDTVLYSDQTYGQRITVFSVPDPNHAGTLFHIAGERRGADNGREYRHLDCARRLLRVILANRESRHYLHQVADSIKVTGRC